MDRTYWAHTSDITAGLVILYMGCLLEQYLATIKQFPTEQKQTKMLTGTTSVSKNKLIIIYGLLDVCWQVKNEICFKFVELISYLSTEMMKMIWQKEHSVGENSFLLPLSVIIKKKLKEMGKEKHWNGCSMNWKYVIFTIQWFKDRITHEEHDGRMEVNTFN